MKDLIKIVFVFSAFTFFSCNQNQVETDSVIQDPFIDNALSILKELGNYYPSEDVALLFSKGDTNGYKTATFSLKGKTKEAIELGSIAKRESMPKADGTTCKNSWDCGQEIKKCLDNGDDAIISNGACEENSLWCVKCIDSD